MLFSERLLSALSSLLVYKAHHSVTSHRHREGTEVTSVSVADLVQQGAVKLGRCQVAEVVHNTACKTEGNLPSRFGLLLIPNSLAVPPKFC